MKEALRQITIEVISPDQTDINFAAESARELINNLSPQAMINIEVSAQITASEEEKKEGAD